MHTVEQVLELLQLVYDPELGINIVDLGLVYDIQCQDEKIYIKMTLTTPGCPLHDTIVGGVKSVLMDRLNVEQEKIKVDLVWEPKWSPDMISEDGKFALGFF
ncbi:metal-sulfur cluster assembly factor [Bacillus niameyensis]|uniref:metal-sulfur cluster assembly factor n=1 Tax=Bacillus niameyensis TaxID=1522308 RepID=UPI000781D85C|nr:metal-sulfur cluster assembly factor [Bacillus niameyensis]